MHARANPRRPTDRRRADRMYRAIDAFNPAGELAKRVYHLGTPHFTESGRTAWLNVTPEGKPTFWFNRSFFDSLGPEERVFVLLHEALHYAFRHPPRRGDRLPAIWNIACDAVTNHFLLYGVRLIRIRSPGFRSFIRSSITFDNLQIPPSLDRDGLTAEQVYDLLQQNLQRALAAAGNVTACDEHPWSKEQQPGLEEGPEFEEVVEALQQAFREGTPAWGNQSLGEVRAAGDALETVHLSWDQVLSQRLASCFRTAFEERWAPPHRKLAWLYPDVLLPADREIEKPVSSVLLAVDASGSISRDVLNRLLGVVRSLPHGRVALTSVSFDTRTYPVDPWAFSPNIRGGGGTSFDAVESFANELDQYPDIVLVLTDGRAPRPTVRHPGRWFWLITRKGTEANVEGIGRSCRIDELTLEGKAPLAFIRPNEPKA